MFKHEKAPRPPSFNEDDVSDKPNYVRSHEKTDEGDIDAKFRKRIRTLQAVDEMVETVVNELQKTGKLDNTYLVFTSDNGWMQGEHRLGRGKNTPYEPSIHMPLGIRGPGIPAGRTTGQLVINEDYAPTFAELGGATNPDEIDGRSLVPNFASDAPSLRHQFLE